MSLPGLLCHICMLLVPRGESWSACELELGRRARRDALVRMVQDTLVGPTTPVVVVVVPSRRNL